MLANLHPDDFDGVVASISTSARDLTAWQHEFRMKFEDGTVRWVIGSAVAEREADGATLWQGFCTDITERKQAEKALRLSEAKIKATLDAIPDLMFEVNLDGRYLDFHSPRTELLAAPPQDLMGKLISEVLPADAVKVVMAAVQEANEQGYSNGRQFALVLAQGEMWFELSISRKAAEPGDERRFIMLSRDITERVRSQEKQRISDLALKAISQGVLISAPDGCILSANSAFLSITGYCESEVLGRTCAFIQGPLTAPSMIEAMNLARLDGTEFTGDILNYRKDGTTFWNELSISPVFDGKGHLIHFIGITRDITARKLAQDAFDQNYSTLEHLVSIRTAELVIANKELTFQSDEKGKRAAELVIANEELTFQFEEKGKRAAELEVTQELAEAANLAKSAFLATMSHELRTPLNAVIGLCRLLADSPLNRGQRDYAEKIQLSAQALRTVIDDVLDFSKIEARELHLERAPFSLSDILRTTAAVLGVGLGDKPVEALFDVGPDLPDALIGDALRLQQILLNLTSNAVKFTSAGVIVVAVRCLTPADTSQGAQVRLQFTVRDTGIGIASEHLGSIFDSFTQVDDSTSRLYGGSGLGLAISARLAALMGGLIEVDSRVGRGSEFRLEVPLTLGRSAPPVAPAGLPSALSVLIVDDHPLARDILSQTCAAVGWQAKAVDSGAAGLEELRLSVVEKRDYDLLLVDWRMPGMDGLEMLRQAYVTPDIGLPLVVLMAAISELEQAVAASDDLSLDAIAVKPLTPGGLLEAVTRAYTGECVTPLAPAGKSDRCLSGMRLLVAEDNELNQEVIGQTLTRAGADVVVVGDGVAVLAALRLDAEHFDAVLMDIQMPLMDGYTATRIIREELGRLDLPIIAVTAYARPDDREKSRLAGMVGHVVKPLDVKDLLALLVHKRRAVVAPSAEKQDAECRAMSGVIALAGLDIGTALEAFGGDAKKYGAILRKFIAQHGGDIDEARRLFGVDDPESTCRLLHGLGGIASFLQAKALARLAIAAEEALRDGHDGLMPGLFDELQAAMGTVKGSYQQFDALHADA
jgi:PAS domain S-box-containing protein